ncbi:hypothetical protein BAE44_0006627 [Dichanthelium oligosanthes]|uniref:Phytocyanin domain-containing protein n=1 Tax=Dichanthelium oligosanthes TaxID=888268 RepID=A0A1E5W4L9_9POAL|nr:hypothetical protein BAE44_0006627 [Dichanthelium oligosanthes]
MSASPRLLLVLLFLFAAAVPPVEVKIYVDDRKRWAPNVNYTDWADRHEFHVGDWLGTVVQVNETAYAKCDGSSPLVSYSRGKNFVVQLNRTGRFYFICSRGYCWNGMKVSVLVQPLVGAAVLGPFPFRV